MTFNLKSFGAGKPDEHYLDWLVNDYAMERIIHYEKLWGYYRNEMSEVGWNQGGMMSESSRPYKQAQEYGLPCRITGTRYPYYDQVLGGEVATGIQRKEVVIENDIAWRIDAMVDFLFGKGITLYSKAADQKRASEIKRILDTVLDGNGGAGLLQEICLLGSIYGFADILLRLNTNVVNGKHYELEQAGTDLTSLHPTFYQTIGTSIILEVLEAGRCLPILNEHNYRQIDFYVQHYWQLHNHLDGHSNVVKTLNHQRRMSGVQKQTHRVEIIGKEWRQLYEDGELLEEGVNPLGEVPVVHIQNMANPKYYEGQGDVEPLIGLQDELNTRLSDRANRITFQSFKMYLGKGIEGFEDRLVAPGRMWSTENPDACIDEFGGDAGSPSEDQHITQIREALDKASGVASLAAGVLKGRVGNLTSAAALKVTMMGLLAKNQRKRLCYGEGIKQLCRKILLALDTTGLYPNEPEEREIEIHWPSPLPENMTEKLQEAVLKQQLGVGQKQILNELGYDEAGQ